MDISLLCPRCKQPLHTPDASYLLCPACAEKYPLTMGIPDLRTQRQPANPAETELVERLLAAYAEADFPALLSLRLESAQLTEKVKEEVRQYQLSLKQRGRQMLQMFESRAAGYYHFPQDDTALDIGCGTGASLLYLARRYRQVVGVDSSLSGLILARKNLETAGLANFQLIQASGSELPFPDKAFDRINALNVIEHVSDLPALFKESRRVLCKGGLFTADSRNRFDLFMPEPHVKLRWVGFLPYRLQEKYVRWRIGMGYRNTRLRSYREIKSLLRRHFGPSGRIVFPFGSAYGRTAVFDRWLPRLERIPFLSTAALWFFPSHLILAQRTD